VNTQGPAPIAAWCAISELRACLVVVFAGPPARGLVGGGIRHHLRATTRGVILRCLRLICRRLFAYARRSRRAEDWQSACVLYVFPWCGSLASLL